MSEAEASGARAPRHLLVVEVTAHRPDQPAYQAYVSVLNARIEFAGVDAGFRVTRVGAADVGTEAVLTLARTADAIVIAGGEDIAPQFYGADGGYPAEGRHSDVADEAQLALVGHAREARTPLLGICRGHQIINVALGGTLRQDLGEGSIHRNTGVPVEQTMAAHEVELQSQSSLARILGADRVAVQSAHHQSLDQIGRGLAVVGIAADGTPEAVEHRSLPIYGVQWHPEDPGADRSQLPNLLRALARDAGEARRPGDLSSGSVLRTASR